MRQTANIMHKNEHQFCDYCALYLFRRRVLLLSNPVESFPSSLFTFIKNSKNPF